MVEGSILVGSIIMKLVTKSNDPERRPDPERYTSRLVDFLGQILTGSASRLIHVCHHPFPFTFWIWSLSTDAMQHSFLSGLWRQDDLLSLLSLAGNRLTAEDLCSEVVSPQLSTN
jgi:hypothetical protein